MITTIKPVPYISGTRRLVLIAASVIALVLVVVNEGPTDSTPEPRYAAQLQQVVQPRTEPFLQSSGDKLAPVEFARIVREFSEDGGYFLSDNFTSNETAYLYVISKMKQLGATGGAYVGVGPEQNFTYIAKTRPRIAFIVDIRRQAMIQHLMFKAVFHLSANRTQFLCMLLSKPPTHPKEKAPSADSSAADILAFISQIPAADRVYDSNLATIRKTIRDDFQIPLTAGDLASLEYVYKSFRTDGLEIAFRMDGFDGWFPTLKELILQPDQFGKPGNFLATRDDYDFVRDMHERNMIIPVVGDFAGKKALLAVGDYLRKNGYSVTAFYTSNVEQYLFENGVFPRFVENVRKLPITDRSLFIRSVLNMRYSHPASIGGHMMTTFMQKIPVFLKDYDEGLYKDYSDMVTTHYIAGESR